MSDSLKQASADPKSEPEVLPPDDQDEPSRGPSLFLLYGILAIVMVIAMGIAALIVLPFYHRR